MKRIYVAISLIILTAIICVISSSQIDKKVSAIKEELDTISVALSEDNLKKAKELIKKTSTTKNKIETTLGFFVDADKIEDFNISYAMIEAHIKDKNIEHALESLHECELMLEEILKNEKISIENIM